MKKLQSKSVLLCGAALSVAMATSAFAQDAAGGIEEVVVTAQKRSENLQKVAAAVSAVTADTLQRQGVKQITDIARTVPEITVATGAYQNITIRGIRTGAYGPSTDSPNAVHVDGVYMSRFTGLQGFFFDIQRVEVLAGPQGTLYGRNSAGGTMNIITNRPTQTYGGFGSIEFGNYDLIKAEVALNLPLSDTLAIRAAFSENRRDGYNRDNNLGAVQETGGRLSALWKPTENDTIFVSGDISKQGGRGADNLTQITNVLVQPRVVVGPTGTISLANNATAGGTLVPIQLASDPGLQQITQLDNDRLINNTKNSGAQITWDHDLSFATLTAQGSYRSTQSDNYSGSLTGAYQDARLIAAGLFRPSGTFGYQEANSRWNAQEIRLTSNTTTPLSWVGGLYRFHEHSYNNHNGAYGPAGVFSTNIATAGQVTFTYPQTAALGNDTANPLLDATAYAAFGQGTYSLLENRLHLTGGLRYNREKKHGTGYIMANGVKNPRTIFDRTATFKKTTYKLNASYDITSRNLIYVDHSTGFKSGGFAYGSNPQYAPENIKSYEIGSKNRFLDNRLQVNFSAWHYDYKGQVTTTNEFFIDPLLISASNPTGTYSVLNVANAANVKVNGQSVQVDFALTENDFINFNAIHNNAKYAQFDYGPQQAAGIASGALPGATLAMFNYTGTQVGGVADYVINGSYSHTFHVLGGGLDTQVSAHYIGKRIPGNQASRANVNAYIIQPAYTTVDLSVRYAQDDAPWSITANVRNLAGDDVVTGRSRTVNPGNFFVPTAPQVTSAYESTTYAAPRTYSLTFNAKF